MGMFDYINIKYPLQFSLDKGIMFQSKSLERNMALYKITKQGKLLRQFDSKYGTEIPQKDPIWGHYEYYGPIEIHAIVDAPENYTGDEQWWLSYELEFRKGKLISVDLRKYHPIGVLQEIEQITYGIK